MDDILLLSLLLLLVRGYIIIINNRFRIRLVSRTVPLEVQENSLKTRFSVGPYRRFLR